MSAGRLKRVVIAGLGLIGGSVAGALKRNDLCDEVLGWVRRPEPLEIAGKRGWVDGGGTDLPALARDAELVLIAVPLASLRSTLEHLRPLADGETVLTDAVSVKCEVLEQVRGVLGGVPQNFVPGHPIAGSERDGVAAADPELFRGRKTVLTPTAETAEVALHKVRMLWRGVGAEILELSPEEHDAALAATSHLPHLLAYAAMQLLEEEGGEQLLRLGGSGLEDFSRIAGADPALWRDISLANREALQKLLERFEGNLQELRRHLQSGDGRALQKMFARAQKLRRALQASKTAKQ